MIDPQSNTAYGLVIAGSMAIVAAPQVIAGILGKRK